MLNEKLEDGRSLMNSEALRDYLQEFLLDAVAKEIADQEDKDGRHPNSISLLFASLNEFDRDKAIQAVVDSLFFENGTPLNSFHSVFGALFIKKINAGQDGDLYYVSDINTV